MVFYNVSSQSKINSKTVQYSISQYPKSKKKSKQRENKPNSTALTQKD